jgi:hypothetical protein
MSASEPIAIVFEEAKQVYSRRSFLNAVKRQFAECTKQAVRDSIPPADIHLDTLSRYQHRWLTIRTRSVCLSCLRRRGPPHTLPCGHMICSNCVRMFYGCSEDDPFVFLLKRCLLCQADMPEELRVRMHPPTAGIGVFCVDGGGVRGVMPLQIIKQMKDYIDLPISPFNVLSRLPSGSVQVSATHRRIRTLLRATRRFDNCRHVYQWIIPRGVHGKV